MKKQYYILILIALMSLKTIVLGQTITRIDGSKLNIDSLNIKVEHLMKVANVSGVAISIFNDNKLKFSKTYGFRNVPQKELLTDKSILYAASFSKAVFAYVVMKYVEKNALDLDKPLVEYLSKNLTEYTFTSTTRGYKDLMNDDRYKKITARMCLNHTTGFPNWRWFEEDKKLKIKFEPGSRYSYSGEGMYLLQFVLEEITKKDYETIAQELIFKPFGMTNTSQLWQTQFDTAICYGHNTDGQPYKINKPKTAKGTGSMSTTLSDFNAFFAAFINQKNLSKNAYNELTKAQIRIRSLRQFGPLSRVDSTDNDNIELSYGLGVGLFKTPHGKAIFKEGHDDGWGHYFVYFPKKKTGIIIMTNNDNGESIFKELLAYSIGDIYTPWRWENYIPYNEKN